MAELVCGALAAAVFAACLYHIWTHVPWRDENQALLIARDSPDLQSLFSALRCEGHPALWHLLLHALSGIVPTPDALKIAQTPVTAAIFALVWFKSPFNPLQKLLLLLGYFFLLEYTVIARGYGLGVALFFAFLAWRRSPWSWVLLGLLANTSVLFAILAGFCGLLLLLEGQRNLAGLIACAALFGFAAFTAYPAPDAIPAVEQGSAPLQAFKTLLRLSGIVVPFGWSSNPVSWLVPPNAVALRLLLALGAMAAALLSLRRHPVLVWIYLGFAATFLLFSVLVFTGYDRHFGILWIALIGMHWIAAEDRPGQATSRIFQAWTAAAALLGPLIAYPFLTGTFSGDKQAAHWLRDNAEPRAVIAAYPAALGIGVSAWLDQPTYNLQTGAWNSFMRWNFPAEEKLPVERLIRLMRDAPPGPLYVISGAPGDRYLHWLDPETRIALARQGYSVVLAGVFRGRPESVSVFRIDR